MKKKKNIYKMNDNPEKITIECRDEMISNHIEKILEEAEDFEDIIGDLITLDSLELIKLKIE